MIKRISIEADTSCVFWKKNSVHIVYTNNVDSTDDVMKFIGGKIICAEISSLFKGDISSYTTICGTATKEGDGITIHCIPIPKGEEVEPCASFHIRTGSVALSNCEL